MNNERNYVLSGIVALIVIVGAIYFFASRNGEDRTGTATSTAATTTGTSTTTGGMVLPYGRTTIGIGETAKFRGISVTPLSIVEDSRCPVDVQCIQAGTVRVSLRTAFDNGTTRQDIVRLGTGSTIGTFSVMLSSVEPEARSGKDIEDDEYELTFEVRQSAVTDEELIGK